MAEQFYTILTNVGKAKIANALPTGQKVNLTKMKIGDSNGSYYNPSETQTDLVHKIYECNVTSVEVDENNPSWITITAAIPSDVGGFSIREVGIYDDNNSLIAIGKYPETYKPVASDGSTKELYIKMTLEVTNASSVELKIDPTVILATKKDISTLDEKIENNTTQLNDKANYNDIYNNADVVIALGYSNKKTTGLYATFDGENYSRVCDLNFPNGWDHGLIYYDGYFYVCYDYKDKNYNGYSDLNSNYFLGGNKLGCSRTKDFISFETWDIPVPSEFKQTFSPKFIIDNDKFYLVATLGDCSETTTDDSGIIGYKKYCYLLEYSDDYRTLSSCTKISLTDSKGTDITCKIDPFIYKKDDTYYLFIKNEDDDIIQIYTSDSLDNNFTIQRELTSFNRVEAPTVFYIKNKYYLFCFNHLNKYNLILTSDNLLDWSTPNIPNFFGDIYIANSSFIPLDNNGKNVFYNFIKKMGYSVYLDDYNKFGNSRNIIKGAINLLSDIDSLKLKNGNVYKIIGDKSITINSFDLSDFNVGDKAYFLISTKTGKITIKQQTNVFFNGEGDLVLNGLFKDSLIEVLCINNGSNKYIFINNVQKNILTKSYIDNNTGLSMLVSREGNQVELSIASKFTSVIPSKTIKIMSFTLDELFIPLLTSYNSYILSDGSFNSIKIYPTGKIEIATSQNVIADSTWFECSIIYLANN